MDLALFSKRRQTMKISVIIPIFNVEYYLEEALDSIINQTIFDDIEVILVDDGSTDNSRFLIEKYAIDYDNVNVFRKDNGGVSSARNYAMKYAKGEYIHFFDSDDFLLYDAYEKLYDFAKRDDYDIVTGNFLRFNHEKTWTSLIGDYVHAGLHERIENIELKDYPKLTWDMLIWNKLYKREFLEKINVQFIEGARFQDNPFSIEVLDKASKIGMMPDYLICWRQRNVGLSATQIYNLKRAEDLIKISHLVNEYLKENIEDKEVLAKKYLKWLVTDIPMFIEMIKDYPEEHQEFLKENAIKIYNLVPKEYVKDLNPYYAALYKMLENGDWENIFLYLSNNYKTNPELPEGLDEEYIKYIDFKKDAMAENLDTYASDVYKEDEKILIKFKNFIPYLKPKEEDEISVRLVNPNADDLIIDPNDIGKDRFLLNPDLIPVGENIPITTYKSEDIEKEFYIKTNSRRSYSYDDYDIDIARGKTSYLRIIKRPKGKSSYIIKEVNFKDDEGLELKGKSDDNIENVLIKDYLDFIDLKYPIEYEKSEGEEYEFTIRIPYMDLLKVPVKKWDFYLDGEFNKINLEENCELINEQYRKYLKNHGNRMVLELIRYDPQEDITKLTDEKKNLLEDKQNLTRERNQLTQEKKKLTEEKNKLTDEKDKLNKEKNNLIKEKNNLIEENNQLKNRINEYKNRKDVRAVDAIKHSITVNNTPRMNV